MSMDGNPMVEKGDVVESTVVGVAENPERESIDEVEGSASDEQAGKLQEIRSLRGLRDFANKSILILVAFTVGGYSQWSVEIDKILGIIPNDSPGKFANGMVDFNPTEEILEGGIPSVVGAVCMLGMIRYVSKKTKAKLDPKSEAAMMAMGAGLGYMTMAIGGGILHDILNVPDVKWGPFK